MAERPRIVVDYGAFPDPPSPLFRDYLQSSPRVRPFYEDWDPEGLARAAERSLSLTRERRPLAAALASQQESRGATPAAQRARALAEDRAVAVVTGQQAGLFGGPLFVLYKAIAALKLARLLEDQRAAPVIPVFWIASDDHDFAEVRSVGVLDGAGQLRTLRFSPRREPLGQPASRIILDETVLDLVAELEKSLPEGPHRTFVLERLAMAYRPGVTLADAFALFLSSLFPDLVILDGSDPHLKALMLPVIRRELLEGSPTSRLGAETGERLRGAGYHQQVPIRPGFLNLFLFTEGERRALRLQDGEIEVRGTGARLALDEALRRLEAEPASFSPGALLRPLAQDHLLPTAAYVGGPAEVAYHAQIGPCYPHFAIPRPALIPRPSVTLVEPAQARALETEALALPALQADVESILSVWAREAYPEIESAFSRAREALKREMDAVESVLATRDATLRAAADAALGRALHPIDSLEEKAMRALKKRDQSRADRLRRTRDALFPGGSFQERGLGLVSVLARHGPGLIEEIRERMDLWATGHQVIYL